MTTDEEESKFLFVGNQLWLDFINTEIISNSQRISLINDLPDLEAWVGAAGVANPTQVEALKRLQEPESVVQEALRLRTLLRQMAEQVTARQAVSPDVIHEINVCLEQQKSYPQLKHTDQGYEITRCYETDAGTMLAPIVESAANLLTHGSLTLVRKCENPQCILYFYDTSKNHARRWCSMGLCGNRFKVAAHYKRSRQESGE